MELSPDPSLKELNVFWEKQYWWKSKAGWDWAAHFYEDFMLFMGQDRRPRDVTRADIVEWKAWLHKKGRSKTRIARYCEYGSRFYRLLDELELVEKDWNPFKGMAPRRIRA